MVVTASDMILFFLCVNEQKFQSPHQFLKQLGQEKEKRPGSKSFALWGSGGEAFCFTCLYVERAQGHPQAIGLKRVSNRDSLCVPLLSVLEVQD